MNNTSAANSSKENGSEISVNFPLIAEGIVWCSVHGLLSVSIAVGNLLIIALFAVNKRLRKRSLFLVINMAIADLMYGALSLPLYIYVTLGMYYYQLWTGNISMPILYLFLIVDRLAMSASLISVAFISCERFYAIHRPFKHRTLTVRIYRIVIFIVWTLAFLHTGLSLFNLGKPYIYVKISLGLTLTFIICSCNIAIWRKFQHGSVASQQQNRNLQNERLTRTLLFVSILALLCWLPVIIVINLDSLTKFVVPGRYLVVVIFANYLNASVNPVVYALRIPEFRQGLTMFCFRRRETVNMKNIGVRNKDAVDLTPTTQLRTLQNDCNHGQLKSNKEVIDTKL